MNFLSINSKIYQQGSVHGRFQPPHNGHIEYILAAKERCSFLWIGITRYDIHEDIPCNIAKHRTVKSCNPLTYFERINIISEILKDSGIDSNSFSFIPFPIDQPKRLPDFLPTNIPCFTTVYDDWNRHKIKELEKVGYKVIILWEREKKVYTGQVIRESIRLGTQVWETMVPQATRKAVKTLGLCNRLTELSFND